MEISYIAKKVRGINAHTVRLFGGCLSWCCHLLQEDTIIKDFQNSAQPDKVSYGPRTLS